MTRIDETELLDAFARRVGMTRDTIDDRREWVRRALATLTHDLPRVDVRALADELPETLSSFEAEPLRLDVGRDRELVESLLRVLGASLSPEARLRMEKHLPRDLAGSLSPRETPEAPPPSRPPPESVRPRATLATGRPGSTHPISEGRPDVAHRHSVARADDPHADTKLSSARGTTQERLHESLAEGEPPHPTRTIADD